MSIKKHAKNLGYSGVVVLDKLDVKKRYRELSKKHHPDVFGGSADKFLKITESYKYLLDFHGVKVDLSELSCNISHISSPFDFKVNNLYFSVKDIRL